MNRRTFLRALAAGLGATASAPLLHHDQSEGRHPSLPGVSLYPVGDWISHRPMRPLPEAASRSIDERSRAYFLSPTGRDSNSGTDGGRAWATLRRAAESLRPGDTLYAVGGHYWLESGHVFNRSGVPSRPITVRALPGQLAILDGGYREFFESPDTAWEPCPAAQGGVEGEYWSTRVYPLTPETRIVAGNFGDSMVPLFRYASLFDLRSQNELHFPALSNRTYEDPVGIYCGPGAMWNSATRRIHIRLSHTHIPQLSEVDYLNHGPGFNHNYTGETDPRNVPLVLHRNVEAGFRGSHIRIQDLVFQGQGRVQFGDQEAGDVGMEVDGVHVYAGSSSIVVGGSGTLTRSKFRGFDAPWSNRFNDKNRSEEGQLIQLAGPTQEVSHCEFTDHHDGIAVAASNLTVDFHHNLVENMNDDGLDLNPRHPTRMARVWQNYFSGILSYVTFSGGGEGVISADDVGCYIYRNLFDLRRRILGGPPRRDGRERQVFRGGLLMNEHARAIRPNLFFYHNDLLLPDGQNQEWHLARLGDDFTEATFRVYNNILVQVTGQPKQEVRPIASGTFDSRNNLLWGLRDGVARKRSQEVYGDPRFVRLTADWTNGTDLHLQPGSPAIDAGFEIPSEWPDPLRSLDPGQPDIGAIPYGVTGEIFGPDAAV